MIWRDPEDRELTVKQVKKNVKKKYYKVGRNTGKMRRAEDGFMILPIK